MRGKGTKRIPAVLAGHATRFRRRRVNSAALARLVGLAILLHVPALAAESELTELSLEELMNVEVTSVSKKAEKGWKRLPLCTSSLIRTSNDRA